MGFSGLTDPPHGAVQVEIVEEAVHAQGLVPFFGIRGALGVDDASHNDEVGDSRRR